MKGKLSLIPKNKINFILIEYNKNKNEFKYIFDT